MFHFVINPASQSGNADEERARFKDLLDRVQIPYKVHYSKKKGDITRICRELSLQAAAEQKTAAGKAEPMCLVIVGGDGTMNEAVNGIADFSAVRVGFLMSGSGNDLGRDLYAGASPEEILKTILRGEVVRRIDVGEVEYHDADPSSDGPDAAAGSVRGSGRSRAEKRESLPTMAIPYQIERIISRPSSRPRGKCSSARPPPPW